MVAVAPSVSAAADMCVSVDTPVDEFTFALSSMLLDEFTSFALSSMLLLGINNYHFHSTFLSMLKSLSDNRYCLL